MVVVLGLLVLIVCLIGASDARLPQRGDYVRIGVTYGISAVEYWGTITDIGDGIIVINSTAADLGNGLHYWGPIDVAIGIGSIVRLQWPPK